MSVKINLASPSRIRSWSERILPDGQIVGEVTSGAWGYRVGASIALGMLKMDLAFAGSKVEIDIYGQRVIATVQSRKPLWDPQNERLMA